MERDGTAVFGKIQTKYEKGESNIASEENEQDSMEQCAELFRKATLQGRLKTLETTIFYNSEILCLELYEFKTDSTIGCSEDLTNGTLSHSLYFKSEKKESKLEDKDRTEGVNEKVKIVLT